MPNATQEHSKREALMRTLAGRLEFAVQKVGDCFTLLRTTDVVPPVCAERLTLDQPRSFYKLGNCAAVDRNSNTSGGNPLSVEGKHD